MGLIDRLFGKTAPEGQNPPVRFGRYTDTYKSREQYKAWDKSLQAFEQGNHMDSYRSFFDYLYDPREDNIRFRESEQGIEFELFQGSKIVTGIADTERVRAEAKVARTESMNIGFLRRLIDQNFNLKYSRFALDGENNISIVFDTYSLDCSPYKIYYGLKEMAANADKQDDLLLDEFSVLKPIGIGHLADLPEAEKEVKYEFIKEEIGKVFAQIDSGKPDPQQYPGANAFLLLHLCYKLDFLTKPEGHMMEVLERIHRQYFSKDERNAAQKALLLRKEFQKLLDRSKSDYFKEMYQVPATFGITSPVNHDRVVAVIDGEIQNMNWYMENKFPEIALSIAGYIVGFCLFNYAVPKPVWDLFHLYYRITEGVFFKRLGFQTSYYDPATGAFDKKAILKSIRHVVEANAAEYPKLHPQTGTLEWSNLPAFAKSFLLMVRQMDATKTEREKS